MSKVQRLRQIRKPFYSLYVFDTERGLAHFTVYAQKTGIDFSLTLDNAKELRDWLSEWIENNDKDLC